MREIKWWGWGLLIVLPALVIWGALQPSLGAGLVWDDKFLLAHPSALRQGFSISSILSPILINPAAYWRPVGMLFLAPQINILIDPWAAHVASLMLFSLLCVLAGSVAIRLVQKLAPGASPEEKLFAGLAVACVLALHSAANQAGYWIANRFHLAGAIVLLLGVLIVDSMLTRGKKRGAWFVGMGMLLGAGLSSEPSIGWSFMALGILGSLGWRGGRAWAWGMILAGSLLAWLRVLFIGSVWPLDIHIENFGVGAISDLADAAVAQAAPWWLGLPGQESALNRGGSGAWPGLIIWGAAMGLGILKAWSKKASGLLLCAWGLSTMLVAFSGRMIAPEGLSYVWGGEYVMGCVGLALALTALIAEERALWSASERKRQTMGAFIFLMLGLWFAAGASNSRSQSLIWQSDLALWGAAQKQSPASPLASGNAMVALSRSGKMQDALAIGEALWTHVGGKENLSRQELASIATYASLLQQSGDSDGAAAKLTLTVPKSAKEPLLALTAATIFIERGNWSDAINAAAYALGENGKAWKSKKMAAALQETWARAELGAGRSVEAEKHLIESKKLLRSLGERRD